MHVDSRAGSAPAMKRLLTQKSMRKGLARGSIAMLGSPPGGSHRGEPVSGHPPPAATGADSDAEV